MKQFRLCAPFEDSSGYGEFARHFAYLLQANGQDFTCRSISLPSSSRMGSRLGYKYDIVKNNPSHTEAAAHNIIFMIPPLFDPHRLAGAKNIGFTMFEADGLPEGWAAMCNKMDAIFVPSSWNKHTFEKAGVVVPILVVPPGIATLDATTSQDSHATLSFYSIFQWTERKNPANLLRAYFVAMQGKTDVKLVLKSYIDQRSPNNEGMIQSIIEKIKKELRLKHYPEVSLITKSMSSTEMSDLHLSCDILLSPHRGEGWNMPAMEAMLHGNAVIATNFSGNTEFMNSENSILLDFFKAPCYSDNLFAPFFNGNMMWAEPDMDDLIQKIRWCYDNRSAAKAIGACAQKFLVENFSEENVFAKFQDAVVSISKM